MALEPDVNILSQIRATRALIKFIKDHEGTAGRHLRACLLGLESRDIDSAVAAARRIKPHGMGGLTDWIVPATHPGEDEEYLGTVLHALVDHWWERISWSFPEKE